MFSSAPTPCNYLQTHAKLPASGLEPNTVVSMLTPEPQLTSYVWYLVVTEVTWQVKTLSGLCTQTLTCIPNIRHQDLSVLNDTWTGKLQTTAELLLGQLLKGEGHYSAYCPLLPILYCFSRRILSMKTVRIPNWNSFQRRLTFSMAQQFSLLRKAILFQSREGVYYFRI